MNDGCYPSLYEDRAGSARTRVETEVWSPGMWLPPLQSEPHFSKPIGSCSLIS